MQQKKTSWKTTYHEFPKMLTTIFYRVVLYCVDGIFFFVCLYGPCLRKNNYFSFECLKNLLSALCKKNFRMKFTVVTYEKNSKYEGQSTIKICLHSEYCEIRNRKIVCKTVVYSESLDVPTHFSISEKFH